MKSGATLQQAQNEIAVLAKSLGSEFPAMNRNRGAAVRTQFEIRTRDDDVNWKFGVIFGVLALSVLLVACSNVAGLLLSRARARTREVAIRLAIGALSSDVLRLVMGKGLMVVAIGTVIGLAMGFAVERLMNAMFDSSGIDVVAYIIVVPSLFLVTMLAAYLPARRASQIAPTQALRYE